LLCFCFFFCFFFFFFFLLDGDRFFPCSGATYFRAGAPSSRSSSTVAISCDQRTPRTGRAVAAAVATSPARSDGFNGAVSVGSGRSSGDTSALCLARTTSFPGRFRFFLRRAALSFALSSSGGKPSAAVRSVHSACVSSAASHREHLQRLAPGAAAGIASVQRGQLGAADDDADDAAKSAPTSIRCPRSCLPFANRGQLENDPPADVGETEGEDPAEEELARISRSSSRESVNPLDLTTFQSSSDMIQAVVQACSYSWVLDTWNPETIKIKYRMTEKR